MRHQKRGRKLNRTASHRKALFSNMAASLVFNKRIITTHPIAKELQSFVERLVTYAKKNDVHGRRLIQSKIIGKLLFISGQISIDEKGNLIKGKIGKDLNTNQGYEAAKRCGLAIISQVKKACDNDLSKVKSCI